MSGGRGTEGRGKKQKGLSSERVSLSAESYRHALLPSSMPGGARDQEACRASEHRVAGGKRRGRLKKRECDLLSFLERPLEVVERRDQERVCEYGRGSLVCVGRSARGTLSAFVTKVLSSLHQAGLFPSLVFSLSYDSTREAHRNTPCSRSLPLSSSDRTHCASRAPDAQEQTQDENQKKQL